MHVFEAELELVGGPIPLLVGDRFLLFRCHTTV
jgi:hypothetical protein